MLERHNNVANPYRNGITMMETVLSLVILGGAFVAALNTIASARGAQAMVTQRQLGLVLAEDLMAEVLSQDAYKEGLLFGPEVDEVLGRRADFDAVDDFDGWTSSPPVDAQGVTIQGTTGYTRTIEISYVRLNNISTKSLTDQGVLRITVTVLHGSKTVATLVAYLTDATRSVISDDDD